MEGLLSPDERTRAARLRLPAKAHAFILARACLRQILARYLECAPAELVFAYGAQGKPALAGAGAHLHFNLSHSGDRLLLAVADRPVGIDLERIDPAVDVALLAERFFTPGEQALLLRAPLSRRRRLFYRLWTRKEAYLKGKGSGFADSTPAAASPGWWLRSLFVQRDYLAALAVHGEKPRDIQRWTGNGMLAREC